jgi:hypothetical protein
VSAYLTPATFLAGLVAVAVLVAFRNWRWGIALGFLIGIVQDPIRKLTPATPGLMAVSSAPVWIAVILSGLAARPRSVVRFQRAFPHIATWMLLLTISLIPATLQVFKLGPVVWQLALIGLYGYLCPLGAILIGAFVVRSARDLRRLMLFYLIVTGIFLVGVLLEYQGSFSHWRTLGTWALGANWDRYGRGYALGLMTGFYRSPDVMAWHAATVVILSLTLALQGRRARAVPLLGLAVLGAICLVLGGRRKMIMMPVIWLAVMLLNLVRQGRLTRVLALAGAAALSSVAVAIGSHEIGVADEYYTFAGSTRSDAVERISNVFVMTREAYDRYGALGLGIGTATQGSHHLGLPFRTFFEGGLDKLMVELGVFGVVCALALAIRLATTLTRQLRSQQDHPAPLVHLGLVGLIAANAGSFFISHQAYGDSVVMFGTGMTIGLALSGAHWRHRFQTANAPVGEMS